MQNKQYNSVATRRSKPIQFYTTIEMKHKLEQLAELDGRSVSNYLRFLINNAYVRARERGYIK